MFNKCCDELKRKRYQVENDYGIVEILIKDGEVIPEKNTKIQVDWYDEISSQKYDLFISDILKRELTDYGLKLTIKYYDRENEIK